MAGLWRHESIDDYCDGITYRWRHDSMTSRFNDVTVKWRHDSMTSRINDVIKWRHESMTSLERHKPITLLWLTLHLYKRRGRVPAWNEYCMDVLWLAGILPWRRPIPGKLHRASYSTNLPVSILGGCHSNAMDLGVVTWSNIRGGPGTMIRGWRKHLSMIKHLIVHWTNFWLEREELNRFFFIFEIKPKVDYSNTWKISRFMKNDNSSYCEISCEMYDWFHQRHH